jgi:hypothetical protein
MSLSVETAEIMRLGYRRVLGLIITAVSSLIISAVGGRQDARRTIARVLEKKTCVLV